MSESNTIIERIRKLLKITIANGASENEAEIALQKANKLIEEYQIYSDQLDEGSSYNEVSFNTHKRQPEQFKPVIHQISLFFGVFVILKGRDTYSFYGKREFCELAKEMAERAEFECEMSLTYYRESEEYKKQRYYKAPLAVSNAYKKGFYNAVLEKLCFENEARSKSIFSTTGRNLVLNIQADLRRNYEEEHNIHLQKHDLKINITVSKASLAGRSEGQKFRINQELGKSEKIKRIA